MLPLSGIHGEIIGVLLEAAFISQRFPRRVELERRLQNERTMPEERKSRQLIQLGKKESTYLRLRRTKLSPDDFRTVKVIGKGAFGEVRFFTQVSKLFMLLCNFHPRSDWYKKWILGRSTP